MLEASVTATTVATENMKLLYNGHTFEALGWECLPIIVDSFGVWGRQSNQYLF